MGALLVAGIRFLGVSRLGQWVQIGLLVVHVIFDLYVERFVDKGPGLRRVYDWASSFHGYKGLRQFLEEFILRGSTRTDLHVKFC
jgi:hypothetical protein